MDDAAPCEGETEDFPILRIQHKTIDRCRHADDLCRFEIVAVVRNKIGVENEGISKHVHRIGNKSKKIHTGIKRPHTIFRLEIHMGNGDQHVPASHNRISGSHARNFLAGGIQ